MAEDPQFASRLDSKRKYEDQTTPPPPVRRSTGFSAPIASTSPDSHANKAAPPSYNSVPPPADEIQLAKQRAQEIAARLFNSAEAKRPRVESVGTEDWSTKGFGELAQKQTNLQGYNSQASLSSPVSMQGSYGFQGSSKKIDIPNGRVGVIIGKGGETIKYLQLQSGAKIQVTRDMDADPNAETRTVELMGTSEQIIKAEQLINDVLAEADVGGSGILAARRFGPAQVGSEQFIMKVPNNKVGLIIGKGGETIKNMQARSGARIQLIPLHLPLGDASTERTVQIDGTNEQIEAAKQLVGEVVSENRVRNPPVSGGYPPQHGYRPPRPPTNWGPPGPPMQQAGYGYMQPGTYPGPPYNASQPPYGGYPPPPSSAGYSSGWDQSSAPSNQQVPSGSGYDYYNQQPSQHQQSSSAGPSAPGDNPSYNYGQQPASNYGSQGSYGDNNYSQPPVVHQGGYSQDGYGGTGGYHTPASQQGYNQSGSQPGYDQSQGYSCAPGFSNTSTPNQDPPAAAYGPTGPNQGPLSQQIPPPVHPPAANQQGNYNGPPPAATPPNYEPQAPTANQPGYGVPPVSQSPFARQPPIQPGYSQPGYGQPPAGQKPGTQPVYGQNLQVPPTTQAGYMAPMQPGYSHSQMPPSQSGYGQADPGSHRPLAPVYGSATQTGYGQQQAYGAPPTVSPAAYGQQPPPSQQYGDYAAAAGYSQPPVYSSDGAASGSAHGSFDAASGTQAVPSGVTKASPQT